MATTLATPTRTATQRHLTTAEAHVGLPIAQPFGVPQVQMSLHFLSGALDQDVELNERQSLVATARAKHRGAGYLSALRDLVEKGTRDQILRHLSWAIDTLNEEAMAAVKEVEG